MTLSYPEHSPNARLIRYPNPTDAAGWPAAESSKIFILGAVTAVGAALHGDEWTGRELTAVQWRESPKAERARDKLSKPMGAGTKSIPRSLASPTPIPKPKPRHFEHIRDWVAEQRQPIWEENGRATKRLIECVNWLAQRCRDGDLVPYARPASGGEVTPMQASEWIIDDPMEQFVIKGGSRRRFNNGGYVTPLIDSFVFFDRTELQEVLAREPDAPQLIAQADLSRLSPYLRLAVRVALEQGYFSEQQTPKIAARTYEVHALWDDYLPGVPYSPSAAEQLARFTGFPDAAAIANGQKGGRGKKKSDTQKV